MFQIEGDYGVIIGEDAVNVGLVHAHTITLPSAINSDMTFDCGFYLGKNADRGIVMDIAVPEYINYPMVGVSFKYGVAYAQLTFKHKGKRVARIYLAVHKQAFIDNYPQYQYASHLKEFDFMREVIQQEQFKVLFFDINPSVKQTGLGLEIYNSDGKMVYDSDLPTLNNPTDLLLNTDKYRTIFIAQSFYPIEVMHQGGYPPIKTLIYNKFAPILFMGHRQNVMFGEATKVLKSINPNYVSSVSSLEYYLDHLNVSLSEIGILTCY